MQSEHVIYLMIFICLGMIFLMVISGPLKAVGKILLNGSLGAVGILLANFLLKPLGVYIGINLLTTGFVGILGLPGFAALLIMGIVL